jgi:hypothetical protein
MRAIPVAQGSADWFQARLGIVTASEMDSIVSPTFKVRDSKGVKSYVARKVAERWLGEPLATFSGGAAEQGTFLEKEARPYYSARFDVDIETVGFVTSDDGTMGCSPDGMFADGTGIEIKSPQPEKHIAYLLAGVLPEEYGVQVHGSMLVTGAPWWTFMSYCRRLPPLILRVMRDPTIMAVMEAAVSRAASDIDAGYQTLLELNGGPPKGTGNAY